jgi:histidyl-tRNA synthetase
LLSALLRGAGIPAEKQTDALIVLDKLDEIDRDTAFKELADRGIAESSALRLFEWVEAGEQPEWFDWIANQFSFLPGERAGLDNLRAIMALARDTSAGRHVKLQPSLARGLSYYTGAIFEVKVKDLAGSLGGGGRYDNLIGMFLGQNVPACGISLGLERILVVMGERGMFPEALTSASADVMVTIWNADRMADAIRLAGELRTAGLRVDVYPEPDKIGKQFKYASSRNMRFVAVVGDDEAVRGEVAVKNLATGEQASVARSQIAEYIRSATGHR